MPQAFVFTFPPKLCALGEGGLIQLVVLAMNKKLAAFRAEEANNLYGCLQVMGCWQAVNDEMEGRVFFSSRSQEEVENWCLFANKTQDSIAEILDSAKVKQQEESEYLEALVQELGPVLGTGAPIADVLAAFERAREKTGQENDIQGVILTPKTDNNTL